MRDWYSMKKLVNILGFKISWWACVVGPSIDMPYIGPAAMLIFLLAHFSVNGTESSEIKLVIIFSILGTVIDTLMALSGLLTYNGTYSKEIVVAPLWITAMWCGFALLVNHSMAWLEGKFFQALILGAVIGPIAYKAGEGLGAISFHGNMLQVTIMLSIVWGLSLPLIYWVNDRLKQR